MSDIISKSRSMDEGTAPPRKRRRPPCLAFNAGGGKSSAIATHPVVGSVRNQRVRQHALTVQMILPPQ